MVERRSDCGLLYYSRHFRFRDGVEIPRVPAQLRGPRGDLGYLAFAVFVEDSRTFAPVLMIPPWDRELRALRSEQGYMAAALSMPPLVPWVHPDQSEPITPVLPMGSLRNLNRSLIVNGQPVVRGIQPVTRSRNSSEMNRSAASSESQQIAGARLPRDGFAISAPQQNRSRPACSGPV